MLIKEWMSRPVITINHNESLNDAAKLFRTRVISMLPVIKGKTLAGIITKSDIFRCFVSFTGVSSKGQIFASRLQERPGLIKQFTDLIRKEGGRLCSIMTSYDDIEYGYRKVFFHTFDISPDGFDRLVADLNDIGQLYYAADLARGYRKIF